MEIYNIKENVRNKDIKIKDVEDELLGQKKIVERLEGFILKKIVKNGESKSHKARDKGITGNDGGILKEYERNTSAVLQSEALDNLGIDRHQSFEHIQARDNPTKTSNTKPKAIIIGGVAFSAYLSKFIYHMGTGHTIKFDQNNYMEGSGSATIK